MRLSMVARGRNDAYGGPDYIDRTKYCLSKHINNFIDLGLTPTDIELVFVDWGSEASIIPLLLQDAHGFLRYISVPRDVTRLYDPPITEFDFVRSINVGIARSHGDFIMHIDPDVFMNADSTKKLMDYLTQPNVERYQYYFSRFTVEAKYLYDPYKHLGGSVRPVIDSIERFNGYSTACMASKQAWHKVEGYDNLYKNYGAQDIDLFTRFHLAGYTAIDLFRAQAVQLVHIEHDRKKSEPNPDTYRKAPRGIAPNGPNWGLQEYTFEEVIV